MSVYTHVSTEEAQTILVDYGLRLTRITPIQGGIENSNFFVDTEAQSLVLTLFEELSPAEARFLPPLLAQLQEVGVPVAAPLATVAGERQPVFQGKALQLAPRLSGAHPAAPGPEVCRAMGEAQAALHLALAGYPLERANAHGRDWWRELADTWRPTLGLVDRLLLDKCLEDYERLCSQCPALPQGLIHGDLFRDNSLFEGERLSGILDFSETGRDHWLLDMAITINDFCRAWPSLRIKKDSLRGFLAGYESRRPLTAEERVALPVFLAVAALRFWLSRLDVAQRNAAEGRGGEHVLQKDPREMRDMLADRISLSARDLGL